MEIVIKDESKMSVKGIHTFSFCDAVKEEARYLSNALEDVGRRFQWLKSLADKTNLREKLKELNDEYNYYLGILHKKFKTRERVVENLTVTVGRAVLAQRLGGDATFSGTANYCALGDDNTGVVVADATLGNEVYRKAISSGVDSNNIAYLETFFTAAEVVDTFEEYGYYIDGGAGADTGQLFNRFLDTNVKSALETMNVQSVITINDA